MHGLGMGGDGSSRRGGSLFSVLMWVERGDFIPILHCAAFRVSGPHRPDTRKGLECKYIYCMCFICVLSNKYINNKKKDFTKIMKTVTICVNYINKEGGVCVAVFQMSAM